MPLDPSIPLQGQAPPNPLTTLSGYAGLANQLIGVQQGRLGLQQGQVALQTAQQTLAAKQAVGPIIQAHTDANGITDWNGVLADARNNPQAAFGIQELVGTGLAQRGAQIANTTAQTGLDVAQTATARQALAALPKGATPMDAAAVISGLAKTGAIQPEFAAKYAGSMPQGGPDFGSWLGHERVASLSPEGELAAQYGTVTNLNTGGEIKPVAQSAYTGETNPVGAPIPTTLTPEAKTETQPTFQNGAPGAVPKGEVYDQYGNLKASATAATGPAPGGTFQTGPALGQEAGANVTAQGNAQQALALQGRAAAVPNNKALLGNMEGLLGTFDPGPNSQWWKTLGQLGQEYGIALPGAPPQTQVQAQEEFGKFAYQLAQSQFQQLGGTGTDAKLESTMHTSPSDLMSEYGNKGIIHILKGNEDAITAQNAAWQKYQQSTGAGAESYGKFLNRWNRIYDPRVFQSQYMTPQERQNMLKGMTAKEQQQFQTRYQFAHDEGWLQ